MLGSHFSRVEDQQGLIKKRLKHRCFPVNIAKFLRQFFLFNTSGICFHSYSHENVSFGLLLSFSCITLSISFFQQINGFLKLFNRSDTKVN